MQVYHTNAINCTVARLQSHTGNFTKLAAFQFWQFWGYKSL